MGLWRGGGSLLFEGCVDILYDDCIAGVGEVMSS